MTDKPRTGPGEGFPAGEAGPDGHREEASALKKPADFRGEESMVSPDADTPSHLRYPVPVEPSIPDAPPQAADPAAAQAAGAAAPAAADPFPALFEREAALAERERQLNVRERHWKAREHLFALGLSDAILDLVDLSSDETLEKSLRIAALASAAAPAAPAAPRAAAAPAPAIASYLDRARLFQQDPAAYALMVNPPAQD